MKKILFLGFLFVVINGCRPPVPEDIIQPDKMSKILYDIHIVDSYLNNVSKQDSAKKVASAYYNGVYKKFDIDSVTYTKSLDFYYKNPEIMSKMYEDIHKSLQKTKEKTEKRIEAEAKIAEEKKRKLDSLRTDSIKKADLLKPRVRDSIAKHKKDSVLKIAKYKKDSVLKAKQAVAKELRLKRVKELRERNNKPTLK
jgi:hypothetical protein